MTRFVDRAAAMLPGFELTPHSLAVVSRICERLEGIPLALELAAVWLRVLSVDQLLTRPDSRFALLTSGRRGALPRQWTLKATIEWSFDLCSPEEQRLWARLSVFPGGFELDAAEHVGKGVGEGEVRDVSVLDIVAGLVDLARRYRAEGFGRRQLEWVGRLRREHANLRAALEHCLSTPGRAGHASNKTIAVQLVIGKRTVETHVGTSWSNSASPPAPKWHHG